MKKIHEQCYDGVEVTVDEVKKCIRRGHSVMVVMRGPPGCGKTTLARELCQSRVGVDEERAGVAFSTDDYFVRNGRYAFDPSSLDEAHRKNQLKAKEAMEKGNTPVIIDNTNMKIAHMKPYINLALRTFYEIFVIIPSLDWNVRVLAKRNVHGVDEMSLERIIGSFEPLLRFPSIITPFALRIARVADSESDDETAAIIKALPPLPSLPLLSITAGISATSTNSPSLVSALDNLSLGLSCSTPPGLPSLSLPPLATSRDNPLLSLSYQVPPTSSIVRTRTVGTQTNDATRLVELFDIPLQAINWDGPEVDLFTCEPEEEKIVPVNKNATTRNMETKTDESLQRLSSESFAPLALHALYPVAEEFIEENVGVRGVEGTLRILAEMHTPADLTARIPDDTKKGQETKYTLPHASKKDEQSKKGKKNGQKYRQVDNSSVEEPLSHGPTSTKSSHEPLANAFHDDALIPIDVNVPLTNIFKLFFGCDVNGSGQNTVATPMFLLRALYGAYCGETITKTTFYDEDYPSTREDTTLDDAEIAQRLANEFAKEQNEWNALSAAHKKTVMGIHHEFPTLQPEPIASLFLNVGCDVEQTRNLIREQFGEHAASSSRTHPVFQPPKRPHSSSSQQRPSSSMEQKRQGNSSSPVERMTQAELKERAQELHALMSDLGERAAEEIKKGQNLSARDKMLSYQYVADQIYTIKRRQNSIRGELCYILQLYNRSLPDYHIDLHYLFVDDAIKLLDEKLKTFFGRSRGGGKRVLTVITGAGNNSAGGKAELKIRISSYLNKQGYRVMERDPGSFNVCRR